MKAEKGAVIVINNKDDEVVGIIKKDMKTRKSVVYLCTECGDEDIMHLINTSGDESYTQQ